METIPHLGLSVPDTSIGSCATWSDQKRIDGKQEW